MKEVAVSDMWSCGQGTFTFAGVDYSQVGISTYGCVFFKNAEGDWPSASYGFDYRDVQIAPFLYDFFPGAPIIYQKTMDMAVRFTWVHDKARFSTTLNADGSVRVAYGNCGYRAAYSRYSTGDTAFLLPDDHGSHDFADDVILTPVNALPKGMSIAADGTLSGTPTETGTFAFTLEVTSVRDPSDSSSPKVVGYLSYKLCVGRAESPLPELPEGAGKAEVEAALADIEFGDATMKSLIIDADDPVATYREFGAWAKKLLCGTGAAVASPHAADSFAFGAAELFTDTPKPEIVEVVAEPGGDMEMTVTVQVKDGEDVKAVVSAKVAKMFEATSDLSDWNGADAKLTPTVTDITPGEGATESVTFKVKPGDGKAKSAFLRIKK